MILIINISLSQNQASAARLGSDSPCLSLGQSLVPVTIPAMDMSGSQPGEAKAGSAPLLLEQTSSNLQAPPC